jgi:hypothetical protein
MAGFLLVLIFIFIPSFVRSFLTGLGGLRAVSWGMKMNMRRMRALSAQ